MLGWVSNAANVGDAVHAAMNGEGYTTLDGVHIVRALGAWQIR